MSQRKEVCCAFLVIAFTTASGCWFRKNTTAQIPAVIPNREPARAPARPPARATAAPIPERVPPQQPPNAAAEPPPQPLEPRTASKPQVTSRKKHSARPSVAPPADAAPALAPEAAPPEPAPPPPAPATSPAQLREMLTPAQRTELTRNLNQSLSAARDALARTMGRTLTEDQQETANLARTLVSQAEAARKTDLPLAAQLARRAELLARSVSAR